MLLTKSLIHSRAISQVVQSVSKVGVASLHLHLTRSTALPRVSVKKTRNLLSGPILVI